jgi:trehalose 6-phosphate phosphatase
VRDLLAPAARSVIGRLRAPSTLVVLDFDGTLAPIVADRRRARMSERTRGLLVALASRLPVAVLSGRAQADTEARVAGAGVRWAVGGHGAEWPGEPLDRARVRRVAAWRRVLSSRLRGVDGIDVEDKALSLSIHWRSARDPARAAAAVAKAAAGLPGAALVPGKKVLNVVPADAPDKGDALARLVSLARCERVIYVGDDVTDEAAFRARLPVPAVMVRVGRAARSSAKWYVGRREAVDQLLERLAREERPAPAPMRALGPVLDFMRTLWALEHGLHRGSKAMNRRLGVTGPQRLVLRVVERLGPIPPGSLAGVLHLHPASVTRLARTLERRGMLHRRPDPGDRRRLLLALGPAAARACRGSEWTIEEAVRRALGSSSAREVAVARRVVERLADALLAR